MKRTLRSVMLFSCLTAICNICNAQAGQRPTQSTATETPSKVVALKALPFAKPVIPGGDYKASQQTLAMPNNYTPRQIPDRTEIPLIKLPVNDMTPPAVPAVPKQQVATTPPKQAVQQ